MLILVSNDDGIHAPGLRALAEELKQLGEVVVVAPDSEMSAAGHAITIADPLRVKEVRNNGDLFGYSVDGTPADCVKIAALAVMKRRPDVVVSGINQGANYATNIIYSGTVSAATEGTILGIPSVAFSMNSWRNHDFSRAARLAVPLVKVTAEKGLPDGTLLNVNIPAPEQEYKGTKVCRQSACKFEVSFDKRTDLMEKTYYWQGGKMDMNDPDPETDIRAVEEGFMTITPIHYDLTNHAFLDELKSWGI